jgi:hypothetical protein
MAQDNFNFMDLLEDDAWFEAAARREEAVDCEALAGYGWGSQLGAVMANPQGYESLCSAAVDGDASLEATGHRVGFRNWGRSGRSQRAGTDSRTAPSA